MEARARRAKVRREQESYLARNPTHPTIDHIVDNRVFLLGLDELYRTAMKPHERGELLKCARSVAWHDALWTTQRYRIESARRDLPPRLRDRL